MRPLALTALALLVVGAAHVATAGSDHTVTATNFQWSPTPLTVAMGDTVTFVLGGGTHTFVSDSGQGSCSLPCTISFPSEGTYSYHCGIHGYAMTGNITVGTPVAVDITSPADGATVSGVLTITGTATHAEGVTSVNVELGTKTVAATLDAPGASSTEWSATIDSTTGVPNGAVVLVATGSTASGLTGAAAVTLQVANPATVDLAMQSLRTNTPSATSMPLLQYTVANLGNTASSAFHVVAQYEYAGSWRTFAASEHDPLPAVSNATTTLAWSDGKVHVGSYPVRVVANDDGAIDETTRANDEADATAWWETSALPGIDPTEPPLP